jgi:hypothetical protein
MIVEARRARNARSARYAVLILSVLTLAVPEVGHGQQLYPPWGPKLADLFEKYQSCDRAGNEKSPTACNIFLARALKEVYGVTAFADPKRTAGYLSANEIAVIVAADQKWERIGDCSSEGALKQALLDANNHVAVIAVYLATEGHGHVALVLPGPSATTSWGNNVPNSASFFLLKPISESYVGLPLSRAFGKDLRPYVVLYRYRGNE